MQISNTPRSRHAVIDDDQKWFASHRDRKLRLRPHEQGEYGWDTNVALFSAGGEVNVTVLRQLYPGCRIKKFFYSNYLCIEDNDQAIVALLDKLGYDAHLKPKNKGGQK